MQIVNSLEKAVLYVVCFTLWSWRQWWHRVFGKVCAT